LDHIHIIVKQLQTSEDTNNVTNIHMFLEYSSTPTIVTLHNKNLLTPWRYHHSWITEIIALAPIHSLYRPSGLQSFKPVKEVNVNHSDFGLTTRMSKHQNVW